MTAFGPLQRDQWATDAGQSRKLSPTQRFVLARVAAASNMTTLESWRSAQHYANETGFSTKSCSDAIAALIEKGLLSDEGFRARKKCVKLAIPATWTLEGGSNVTLEGGSNVEPPHQKEVPKYIRRRFQSTLEGGSDNPSNYPSNYPSRSSSSVTNEPEPRRSDDDDPVSESEQDEHEVIVSEVASRLAQHDLDERPDHLDPVATPDRWLKATAARRADAHRIEIGAAIACGVTAPAELVAAILANTAPAQAVNGTPRATTVPWSESTNPAVVAERRRLQAVPDLDNDEPHLTREQSRERIRQAKETIKR
jgi:hypothetical protein